jgi:hypothetical protein
VAVNWWCGDAAGHVSTTASTLAKRPLVCNPVVHVLVVLR